MILDILDAFNLFDRTEGILARLRWRDAGHVIRLRRTADWSGKEAEALLRRYGVAVAGRRVTSQHAIFTVKRRQAAWAEHVLIRAGAPLDGGMIDASNAGAFQRHGGRLPRPWHRQRRRR